MRAEVEGNLQLRGCVTHSRRDNPSVSGTATICFRMNTVRSHQALHEIIIAMDRIWNTDTTWESEVSAGAAAAAAAAAGGQYGDWLRLQSNEQEEMSHEIRGQTSCTA